jgi:hypothetical protein
LSKQIKTTTKLTNEAKNCIFEKMNKADTPFAKLTKRKGEKTKINKNKDEKGDIATHDSQNPDDH